MKVFAVASYPVEAAATRYRVIQYIPHLQKLGIEVSFSPFVRSNAFLHLYDRSQRARTAMSLMAGVARRTVEVARLKGADVVFIQREAMLFGPPLFERIAAARLPIVLDLDDPTYLGSVYSVYGGAVAALRWRSKGDTLLRLADVVLCGNDQIAAYVREKGGEARMVPTIVDPEVFKPGAEAKRAVPVIGWIGTQATYTYVENLYPVLERLRKKHDFVFRAIGSDRPAPSIPGLQATSERWDLAREIDDFRSIDIGLYPLVDEEYARGKSGFKAIQYMSMGIPFVMSPVGICATIGEPGGSHLLASTDAEWYEALDRLLSDLKLRNEMGARGRQHVLQNYSVARNAESIAQALRDAMTHVRNRRNRRTA
jgi:glycosyltransferase involved in cell wall biosynthesis